MALQAPELRNRSLQENLERALALSQADKRLGDYFPPVENPSHAWHYDGTEHTGGGFESDMYAFKSRGQIKKEWQVSVVQWARERDVADQAWATEEAARNIEKRDEDRKMKTLWAPEEADIIEARKAAEKAWAHEQMELEGLAPKDQTSKRRSEVPTTVDARHLSETMYRPNLGEANPMDRTGAWLSGRGEQAGIQEGRMDPTEQNELHTMDVYEEELRRKRRSQHDSRARSSNGNGSPVRRPSTVATSKPPSLPPKSIPDDEIIMSPASASQVSFDQSSAAKIPFESPPASEYTSTSRRRSLMSVASAPQTSIPPSLPSKDSRRGSPDSTETRSRRTVRPGRGSPNSMQTESRRTVRSGRGSPDSMQTESRRSARSGLDDLPEPINILSPATEENRSVKTRSRPISSVSRRIESFVMHDKEPITQERPLSYAALMGDSWVDLKNRDITSMKSREPEPHVRSSASSWRVIPPPDSPGREMLFDETIISGLPGTSEPSMSTLVAADRLVSPASQIALAFRQMALNATADPTNSVYLRDMPFTVPGMFSRSALRVTEEVREETETEEEYHGQQHEHPEDDPPTPRQRPTSIPHPLKMPVPSTKSSGPPPNVDKSLPGTPYTMTHSIVSTPEFDADALESAQQTEESYYRQWRESLPPGYSSGSKTPKGSMLKSQRDSYGTLKEARKSTTSVGSAKTSKTAKTSSTGAMGDVEAQEVLNPVRGAERRPSKRSSDRRQKPEGSVTSEGSGSTIKASAHARSHSSASDDGRRSRTNPDRPRERESTSRVHSRHQRSRSDLPPGTSHTRISRSDSESEPELPRIPDDAQRSPVHSSPISVDLSDDGGQYANVPDIQEQPAPGRMSGQTFGLATGTNMTFRESRDWQVSHEPLNDSKISLGSRPQSMAQSMAPSTRSNKTRASTLRASMKSPLANISERDTASELSFRGDDINESGSFGVDRDGTGTKPSHEMLQDEAEEPEETPMDKFGMTPAWRAELWGSVAWDAAAAQRSSSTKRKLKVDKSGNILSGDDKKSQHKSSSSSLGEELKDNFTLGHPVESYHGSQRQSTAHDPSSGIEEHTSSGNQGRRSSESSKQLKHNVGEVVEWHEDSEVGMAGIGAHGIRAKVSYKEPTPESEHSFDE